MNVLALDTAIGETSACLLMHGKVWLPEAAPASNDGKTRSERIVPLLENLLAQAGAGWSDLQALAFSRGPGSFTGLRIAAATLAGLNANLKLPVITLSSLAVTARQVEGNEPIWILEDARAGEVYAGHYRQGEALTTDACLSWEKVTGELPAADYACHNAPPVALDGWQRRPLTIDRDQALSEAVAARLTIMDDFEGLPRYPEPVYLQLSQAERNANV